MAPLPESVFAFDPDHAEGKRWPPRVYREVRRLASYLSTDQVRDLAIIADHDTVTPVLLRLKRQLGENLLPKYPTVHAALKKKSREDFATSHNVKHLSIAQACTHAIQDLYNAATDEQSDINRNFKVDDSLDHSECLFKIWVFIVWWRSCKDNPSRMIQKAIGKEKTLSFVYDMVDEQPDAEDSQTDDDYAQVQAVIIGGSKQRPNLVVKWANPDQKVIIKQKFQESVTYEAAHLDSMTYEQFEDALRRNFALVSLRHDILRVTAKRSGEDQYNRIYTDPRFDTIKEELRDLNIPPVLMYTNALLEDTDEVEFDCTRDTDWDPQNRIYANHMAKYGAANTAQKVLDKQGINYTPG